MSVREHTDIFKGFQIRDICRLNELPEPPTTTKPEPPTTTKYDVVQWFKGHGEEPHCWSVARLVYDEKEACFDLESIGLRWLESHPDQEVCDWILKWCEWKIMELDRDNKM